jgi:hypothetical protein
MGIFYRLGRERDEVLWVEAGRDASTSKRFTPGRAKTSWGPPADSSSFSSSSSPSGSSSSSSMWTRAGLSMIRGPLARLVGISELAPMPSSISSGARRVSGSLVRLFAASASAPSTWRGGANALISDLTSSWICSRVWSSIPRRTLLIPDVPGALPAPGELVKPPRVSARGNRFSTEKRLTT